MHVAVYASLFLCMQIWTTDEYNMQLQVHHTSTGSNDLVVEWQSCTTCSLMMDQLQIPENGGPRWRDATDRHATSFRVSGKCSDLKDFLWADVTDFPCQQMMFRDLWTFVSGHGNALGEATISTLSRKSTSAPLADNHPVRLLLTIYAVCEAIHSI